MLVWYCSPIELSAAYRGLSDFTLLRFLLIIINVEKVYNVPISAIFSSLDSLSNAFQIWYGAMHCEFHDSCTPGAIGRGTNCQKLTNPPPPNLLYNRTTLRKTICKIVNVMISIRVEALTPGRGPIWRI